MAPKGEKKVLRVSSEMRELRPPTKTVVLLGSRADEGDGSVAGPRVK
jgi:hypothetical protein